MIDGLRVPFANPATLLERYEAIFTPTMQETIARAVGVDQPQPGREPLRVNSNGLVIGTNAIHFKQVDGRLRITAIIVPRPDPDAAVGPLAPRSAASTGVARREEARRVGIRIGPRPTQLSGALAAGVVDAYVVWIPKGKVLEVRLERVQNRAALVRVMHAGTGAPLNPRAANGARVVTGRAFEGADYRIDVERTQSDELGPLPYVLSLSLR